MKTFFRSYWKLVLSINLLLGISLWFGFFTDISLRGTISDILFPLFVAILATVTGNVIPEKWKRIRKILYSPSLVGGYLFLSMICILLIPPFTLGFLFMADEIASEVRIQQVKSPNNVYLAEVFFRPVGAYSGGSGRIYVRIVYNYFPVLERDIYYLRVSHADENTKNYLSWIDNNTFYIPETKETINIDSLHIDTPMIAIPPLFVFNLIDQRIEESKLIEPLIDIPVYESKVLEDERDYDETLYKTAERTLFFDSTNDIEEVFKWYQVALSKHPWSILEVKRNSDPNDKQSVRYCIVAEKTEKDKKHIFYWEIFYWNGNNSSYLKVDITTPNPSMGTCL